MARRLEFLIAILLLAPAVGAGQAGAQGVCPRVEVVCPSGLVGHGVPVSLSASVSGGDPYAQYAFNWTVSAGTLLSGQGTPAVTLDTTGLAGQNIKVTVEVGGLPESCAKVEACEVSVEPPPIRYEPFDRYQGLKFKDEKAHLDTFAIALLEDPVMRGYIVMYSGKRGRPAEIRKRAKRIRSYLTNTRGVDPERVVLVHASDTGYEGSTMLLALPRDVEFPFPGEIIK